MASLLLGTSVILAVACAGRGQEAGGRQDPAAAVAAAGEAWLATDQTDERQLERTIKALFEHRDAALAWLGGQVPAALEHRAEPRSKGIVALATHFVLEFLKRENEREWRFAGQYAPLAALQPLAGEQLFRFLLDTPEWYPHTHRAQLVPALRDLQPGPPAADRLAAVVAIARNDALEPIGLRRALAGLLWQWGHKEHAQKWIEELQAACVEGDAEERVGAMLELAEFYYTLRDYAAAARTHRSLGSMAAAAKVPLKPVDLYASACAHELAGERERAFAALERCFALLADASLDSSHRLGRELFEQDPEIAGLRTDPRFAPLLAGTFPKKAAEDGVRR